MKLYIKNMVCSRCVMVVKNILTSHGYYYSQIELGEVELRMEQGKESLEYLNSELKKFGFELIDDRKSRLIEKVKNAIVELVHHSGETIQSNLSDYISSKVNHEYNYISNLFSEIEGTTIEKYFITQKIEKIKELLVYDELSISEIADRMGYSSVAYLSNQFKKQTGFSPSYYKSLKEHKRKSISDL